MGQDTGRLQRRSRVGFRENGPCRKEQQKLALEGSKKGQLLDIMAVLHEA